MGASQNFAYPNPPHQNFLMRKCLHPSGGGEGRLYNLKLYNGNEAKTWDAPTVIILLFLFPTFSFLLPGSLRSIQESCSTSFATAFPAGFLKCFNDMFFLNILEFSKGFTARRVNLFDWYPIAML